MRTRWQGGTAAAAMVFGLLVLGGSGLAKAQPVPQVSEAAKEDARRNYRAAEAKFQQGNYAAALGLYEQAEAIIPIPATKYKIAVCHDRLGHASDAVRWYQTFLDAAPPGRMDDAIAEAKVRLAVLPRPQAQVRIALTPPSPPGLTYEIDNGPAQMGTPALNLSSGHHRIVVQAAGFAPVVVEVDASPTQTKEVRIALTPALGQPPPGVVAGPETEEPSSPRRRSDVPAYVLFGVTAAGVAVGTAFGIIALQDKSNFNALPTTAGADKTDRDALLSDISFAAALALGVTGAVLLITNLQAPAQQTGVRGFFTPYAGPTGGGAVGGLTF